MEYIISNLYNKRALCKLSCSQVVWRIAISVFFKWIWWNLLRSQSNDIKDLHKVYLFPMISDGFEGIRDNFNSMKEITTFFHAHESYFRSKFESDIELCCIKLNKKTRNTTVIWNNINVCIQLDKLLCHMTVIIHIRCRHYLL